MNKRIFLAVKITPEPGLLDVIDFVRDELVDEKIKWVEENQFHITLKFFGDTSEDKIKDISLAIKICCSKIKRFSFDLCNPWYFRDRDQFRVVLMQTERTEKLVAFQKELESAFLSIGIEKEDRVFKPHLTLGRIKSIRNTRYFYELMKQFPKKVIQVVPVSELILFESILKPAGPEYIILERLELSK